MRHTIDRAGRCVPQVVRAGQAPAFLVAGQVVSVVAGAADTGGAFGLMVCEAPEDKFPVPLHYHERAYDTWLCTRGRMHIWGSGQGRVLHPGDFAYVPPGQVHGYQCMAPGNAFFGLVAPGGWEGFFGDAGLAWNEPNVPVPGSQPFDIQRMLAAQGQWDVHLVREPYPPTTGPCENCLPGKKESYFLAAGHGERRKLGGVLLTKLIGATETDSRFAMHTAEGARGASMPDFACRDSFLALHVTGGALRVTLGAEEHVLQEGDTACVPPGTMLGTTVQSGVGRWVICSAQSQFEKFVEQAGEASASHLYPAPEAGRDDTLSIGAAAAGVRLRKDDTA